MMSSLQEALEVELPPNNTLHTEEAREFFDKLCVELGVDCAPPRSTARLIDKLVGEYLES